MAKRKVKKLSLLDKLKKKRDRLVKEYQKLDIVDRFTLNTLAVAVLVVSIALLI